MCMFCRSLFILLYILFGHCVVCSSSLCGFWLPLWYLQTQLFLLSTMTHLILFKLKYPGWPTGFCVGLLLNHKYRGSPTGFCVGLLLNLKYPGSPTGFVWVCCSILSTLVHPWGFVWVCCPMLSTLFIFKYAAKYGFYYYKKDCRDKKGILNQSDQYGKK